MQRKVIFEHLLIIAVLCLGCQHNGEKLFCDTNVTEVCSNDVNVTRQCLYFSKDLESSVATLNGTCPLEGLNKICSFIIHYLTVCYCCRTLFKDIS